MIRLALIGLLLPLSVLAQEGERLLNSCASMLAINRVKPARNYGYTQRERARMDADSGQATAENYRHRTMNYVRQHEYEEAALWLEKTATQFPSEEGFVGEIYLSRLHDYPRALHHLKAFDARTPTFDDMISNNPVSYLRGLVYRNLGNHSQALVEFTTAIDPLEAKHGSEWVNYRQFISRAISYVATGQADNALADLDKAAKNFQRSALVSYHRGRALQQLGRTAEARSAFQDASFFYKALRAQRSVDYQEDEFNLLYEQQIDEALARFKH